MVGGGVRMRDGVRLMIDRLADQLGLAALVRAHRLGHAEMADLRVGEHLVDGVDRAAGHARLVQERRSSAREGCRR